MVSLSTRNSESRGLLATLSNAAMVASAWSWSQHCSADPSSELSVCDKEGGIDVDASYSHWRIISIVLCLVSAFGCMLEYYFTRERITEETINLNVKEEKMPAEKTAGRLYPQQILVDHHSLFPDFPVWPADQKQFHELLCKMDV